MGKRGFIGLHKTLQHQGTGQARAARGNLQQRLIYVVTSQPFPFPSHTSLSCSTCRSPRKQQLCCPRGSRHCKTAAPLATAPCQSSAGSSHSQPMPGKFPRFALQQGAFIPSALIAHTRGRGRKKPDTRACRGLLWFWPKKMTSEVGGWLRIGEHKKLQTS